MRLSRALRRRIGDDRDLLELLALAVERVLRKSIRVTWLARWVRLTRSKDFSYEQVRPSNWSYSNGPLLQLRSTDALAVLEQAYCEEATTAAQLAVKVRAIESLPHSSPAWSGYATAVRVIHIGNVLAAHETSDVREELAAHVRLSIKVLRLCPERHLKNNHRTTIQFALAKGYLMIGAEIPARNAARRFSIKFASSLLPDGFTKEGSLRYAELLLSEALWLEERQPGGYVMERALGSRLASAINWRCQTGSPPAFGDTFGKRTAPLLAGIERPEAEQQDSTVLLTCGTAAVWVSLGSLGPSGYGGHGHLDAGSFELHADSAVLVADPGCTTYEPSLTRSFQRSASAHNMLSPRMPLHRLPIWSGFRYLNPPTPIDVKLDSGERWSKVELTVRSIDRQGRPISTIRRCLTLQENQLVVEDQILALDPSIERFSLRFLLQGNLSILKRTQTATSPKLRNLRIRSYTPDPPTEGFGQVWTQVFKPGIDPLSSKLEMGWG